MTIHTRLLSWVSAFLGWLFRLLGVELVVIMTVLVICWTIGWHTASQLSIAFLIASGIQASIALGSLTFSQRTTFDPRFHAVQASAPGSLDSQVSLNELSRTGRHWAAVLPWIRPVSSNSGDTSEVLASVRIGMDGVRDALAFGLFAGLQCFLTFMISLALSVVAVKTP